MRTLGLIGGMSWVSTAEYYRTINELVAARLGGLHSAKVLLESVDFAEVEELKLTDRWDEVGALLAASARRLEGAGADAIVLCTNTMHHVADALKAAIDVPLVHIGDTTAEAVTRAGVRKVGLLATAFTMEQPFYRERMEQHGLEVVVPDDRDRAEVSRIIYDELCHDVVLDSSRETYRAVMQRLVEAGADGIILGCTEVELLVGPADTTVLTFPSTLLHATAAVDLALGDRPNRRGLTVTPRRP